MKKVIIAVASLVLFCSATSFASPRNHNYRFHKYISDKVARNDDFNRNHYTGKVKLVIHLSPEGVEKVTVVSGVDKVINQQIAELVKSAPKEYIQEITGTDSKTVMVTVNLVWK